MLIILLDIFITIRIRKRAVVQPIQTNNQQGNVQKQMFILMLASIGVFLITNLPVGISKAILSRGPDVRAEAVTRTIIVTVFGWLQSLNYAVCVFFSFELFNPLIIYRSIFIFIV